VERRQSGSAVNLSYLTVPICNAALPDDFSRPAWDFHANALKPADEAGL
jgi:hypothetical protein